jgi:hypothetical protein
MARVGSANTQPTSNGTKQHSYKGISLPPDLDDEVRGEVLLEVSELSLSSAHSLSQKRAVVRVKWYVAIHHSLSSA